MRWIRLLSLFLAGILLVCGVGRVSLAAASDSLVVIVYHEITDPGTAQIPDLAVTPSNFVRQMDWLRLNGYHFVSVDQVLAARANRKRLPSKPVLLSFDDGYRSVYTEVFPVLKSLKAPAVVALVGSWMEPQNGLIQFGDKKVPRSEFMSWEQVREMVKSGLVEVASHTHDLHKGITGNPQGNQQPAASTREYSISQHHYEDEFPYQKRIEQDLHHNSQLLAQELGRKPRVIAWPYGRYNSLVSKIATDLEMPVGLTLDDGANREDAPLSRLRRIMMTQDMAPGDLAVEIALRQADTQDNARAAKIMHVDLDNIYDPEKAQIERNLTQLLERIRTMGVNTVYLQAYADPDGNGAADAVYFPNRHLPMRADLFNHVAWEIRTRTQVRRLYAWMPMLAFELPKNNPVAAHRVITQRAESHHLVMGYPRLSPFSPKAVSVIREIYADLSRRATFDGLLFHDDATLSDYEDASRFGLSTYQKWGLPSNLAAIRRRDDFLGRWTNFKINTLDNLAKDLAAVVRINQPQLRTARNLYAQVALNPKSEVWYSQSLDRSLQNYDFTAIMAMPYLEKAQDPHGFLKDIFEKVREKPGGLNKVVFELQSTDWRTHKDIDSKELAQSIADLYSWGARHIAYYPENPHRGQPDSRLIRPVFDSKSSAPLLSSR
ncbi:polysaccharide deacetylase [Neosynechococcus sphagnicola sy1]|uniref:Polysaccharide deacetylase n=1 Tax=Neosynechococcus sphagnicola sy1 TaxID=1497020 RepID=A0A098TJT7_9CYAN|nr:poly-beta-1,6-N-acetyl-D-glucosamine N-deacetylase PgaB [Neosynechococcus sphagnicola]KGF72102.1 polysaccharide deacetylase [Neosynechococcus sphagnicola sy1]